MSDCDGGYVGSAASEVIEFQDKDGKKTVAVIDRSEGKIVYFKEEGARSCGDEQG